MPSDRWRRAFGRPAKWMVVPLGFVVWLLGIFLEELVRDWVARLANIVFLAVLTPVLEWVAQNPGWAALFLAILVFGGLLLYDYWVEGKRVSDLTIIRAQYGVGENFVDVTDSVRHVLTDQGLSIEVGNWLVAGSKDPAKGCIKSLIIKYRYKGTERTAGVDEHKRLVLP